jgi:glycosyltransferase involved in cell wall biosynthesis
VSQSFRNFRVIVVDQNTDARLEPIIARYTDRIQLVRLTSEPGLNRARNAALRELEADVVAFADDDCWYPSDLFAEVCEALDNHPEWDGVTGRVVDELGSPSVARWREQTGPVDRLRVWTQAVSVSIFLRRTLIEAVGPFDVDLGPGAATGWGAADETDYLLRSLESGAKLQYLPSLTVCHPQVRTEHDQGTIAAGRLYGQGNGRVLRKHSYPWWFFAYQSFRSLGGAMLALGHAKPLEARFHLAVARGRLSGWLSTGSPRA